MERILALQGWLRENAQEAFRALQVEGWSVAPGLLIAAFGFGLLHALLPGHGKLLLAAHYGGRGAWREALLSSMIVIVTHVGSAILIVLAGFAILERTVGRAGRSLLIERVSAGLIVAIGLWLLWRALRPAPHDHAERSGPALAVAGGLTPCPLTTFTMTLAAAQGAVAAGLVLSGGFALGMVATVAIFPLLAIATRRSLGAWIASRSTHRLILVLQCAAAVAIVLIGASAWP
jgi:nickel/cobalt transporter (NicO) family protein